MGLPREVRQLLLDQASPASKARATKLSKQLHAETASNVEKLCDLLPSKKEISSHINKLREERTARIAAQKGRDEDEEDEDAVKVALDLPSGRVVVVRMEDNFTSVSRYWLARRNNIEYVKERVESSEEGLNHADNTLAESLLNGTYPGNIDPETMLGTLRRRRGCVKRDPHYGEDIVKRYILETLSSPLEYLVGIEQATHILGMPDGGWSDDIPMLPILRDSSRLSEIVQRQEYRKQVQLLQMLAGAWAFVYAEGSDWLQITSEPIQGALEDDVQGILALIPINTLITAYRYRILDELALAHEEA